MTTRTLKPIVLAVLFLALVCATGWNLMSSSRAKEALRLYAKGDYRNAVRLSLDHLAIQPWDRSASKTAALGLSRLDFAALAEPHYVHAGDWPALDHEQAHIRAFGLVRAVRSDEAVKAYETMLARQPDDALALQRLATVLLTQRRFPDALVYAQRLAALPGKEVVGNALIGSIAHQDNVPEDASTAYERVIRVDPTLSQLPFGKEIFWSEFIVDLIESGRVADAGKYLTQGLAQAPGNSQLLNLQGRVAFLQGDIEGAERAWNEARIADPKMARPVVGLGQIALKQGKAAVALELLKQAFALAPKDYEAAYQLSLAYRMLGNLAEADRYRKLSEAIRLESNDPVRGMGAMPAPTKP